MSAITNITLADGLPSPLNHTFTVMSAQAGSGEPASWRDLSSSTVVGGMDRVTLRVSRSTTADKVQARFYMPMLDAQGVKVHTTLATVDFVLPDTATLQDRKDILAYVRNAMALAIFSDAVHNGSPAF